jgi:PIN domain nuclease of toxin-antitoxin system
MRYLLDTHAVLWLIGEPERLPAPLLEELARSLARATGEPN